MRDDNEDWRPLQTGEVVQLIAGGAPMTVRYEINDANNYSPMNLGVYCDWLDNEGRLQQATFKRAQLIRLPDVARRAREAEQKATQ